MMSQEYASQTIKIIILMVLGVFVCWAGFSGRSVAQTEDGMTDLMRYEHNLDCLRFNQKLLLTAFSVSYPADFVITDCRKNPDNYVVFELNPDASAQDADFAIVFGHFNVEDSLGQIKAKYLEGGEKFLNEVGSHFTTRLKGVLINDQPLVKEGIPLYRRDYTAELRNIPRLVRLVVIPNFDHGQGFLFMALKKIKDAPEQELPAFDTLTQTILASVEFPPISSMINSITFATELTKSGEPVNPGTVFPSGISTVYAVFDYQHIYPGMSFEYAADIDGKELGKATIAWQKRSAGNARVTINDLQEMSGVVNVRLSVNGILLRTGSFTIGERAAQTEEKTELPPGNTIRFQQRLQAKQEAVFPFYASDRETAVMVVFDPSPEDLVIELRNFNTNEVLSVAEKGNALLTQVSPPGFYKIVARDEQGAEGLYKVTLIGGTGITFNISPQDYVLGRLPEKGALTYFYVGQVGSRININVVPHPDDKLDLAVKVESPGNTQTAPLIVNEKGPGDGEQFSFTLPERGESDNAIIFISVGEVSGKLGRYTLLLGKSAE